ncbi:MAG: hypothetical protein ACJ71W_00610 [Terriglobales bacterium]
MKPVFQTTFGVPHGNCFAAAVASILELDHIPDIDPSLPDEDEWRARWTTWFESRGYAWDAITWDENWKYSPRGYSIANVELRPGVMHAIVSHDGKPVHDPLPGQPFLKLSPDEQRKYQITAYTRIYPKGTQV